jgi:hypothetical protein
VGRLEEKVFCPPDIGVSSVGKMVKEMERKEE